MPTVKETFEQMPSKFRADKAAGVNATIQYDITGDQGAFSIRPDRRGVRPEQTRSV